MAGKPQRQDEMCKLSCKGEPFNASKLGAAMKGTTPYEEIDFSQSSLTSDNLNNVVLNICRRSPRLRILKLFRNQLDDRGAEGIAELISQKPDLEELHLSHNSITAVGARAIVEASDAARSDRSNPLWVRLEHNHVADPDEVFETFKQEYSVCKRENEVRCNVRYCCNRAKVHLPHFNLQRVPFVPRSEQREQALQRQSVPTPAVPTRTVAPKPTSNAGWSGAKANGGYSQSEAAPDLETLFKGQVFKDSSRPSMVLDVHGFRRIMPQQMSSVDSASSQFVCSVCHFVMNRPVMTRCSHLFCEMCFKTWVQNQVQSTKDQASTSGPVPQIQCPQPQCKALLRKSDVMLLDTAEDSKTSGVQLLKRLRNSLCIRCVHHGDLFAYNFGKDAADALRDKGIACSWSGDIGSYEEHLRSGCEVEKYLSPPAVSDSKAMTQAEPEPEDVDGEVRVAKYEFSPEEAAQIHLYIDDLVKIFEVTPTGWAAGVRICRETKQELGDAGWFPVGYLHPAGYREQ